MRAAIAHEWLVNYAGSERVVANLLEAFPGSRLLTTIVEPDRIPPALRIAEPSWLQRVPGATSHHEWLLPVLPAAWALRPRVRDVDIVISSSHACAKAVRIEDGIPHLCYCHTPMRYAWYFDQEKFRLPAALRPPARPAMAAFRRWDAATAKRVTRFVANSEAVASRIRSFYGRSSDVVHPPVRTDFFFPGEPQARAGFLFVGRLVSYKRPDLVVEAFRGSPHTLTVVGTGHLLDGLRRAATPNVRFVENIDDAGLRELYRTSRALVYPGVEDFGIVMAEAQASGLPVIAAAEGGASDIVSPGATGLLLDDVTVESVRRAVTEIAESPLDPAVVAQSAQRFSEQRFRDELRRIALELTS